ncbi:MAG: hypothetical protein U1E73_01235 [Planctomycetota bacterium]
MPRSRIALALCALATPFAVAAQNPCGIPHLVASPTPTGSIGTRLTGVKAFAPNDIWAVGMNWRQGQTNTSSFSWIVHWDGTRFTEVPSPSPALGVARTWCELHAIDGVAPNDIWAAGLYERPHPNNGHIGPQMLLLHWDGTAWTQVPEPLPQFGYIASSSGTKVLDIVAHASNDVDFYGFWPGDQNTPSGPMTAHWDGNSVTVTHVLPPVYTTSSKGWVDVDVLPSGEAWAAAERNGPGYGPYLGRRVNGTWSQQTIPTLPITYYSLTCVGAIASNDVWAAGTEETLNPSSPIHPYTIHWDGTQWQRHPTAGYVNEFVTLAGNDVWAFGTAVEHWDGTAWTLVTDLGATLASAQGLAATALGPCDLWTVGTQWSSLAGPPVAALAVHVGDATAGAATLRLPCTTAVHPRGIVPLATPRIGQTMRVVIGDPFAVTGLAGPTLTAWAWALGPGPLAPCGQLLPGLAVGGGAIEFLLDGSAVVVSSLAWSGGSMGSEHAVQIPALTGFAGLRLTSQAVLVGGNGLVGTAALDLVVGS